MKQVGLVIWLAAATFSGCTRHEVAAKSPVPVRTVVVEMASDSPEVRYSGVVAPDTQVDLAFRLSGYVEHIGRSGGREFNDGDFVPAGAVLARLRPVEYQKRAAYAEAVASDNEAVLGAQQAQLAEAEAALLQATRELDRAKSLFAEKALTRADYEAVETRRDSALARRDSALAQIAAQKARLQGAAAQHDEAALTLDDTALIAPFPGVIIAKRVARGSFVAPGTPAFVLADTRVAKVSFGVPDVALNAFRIGDSLQVAFEAASGREFHGRITTIAPAADATSRVFPVQVTIPNAGQALKIGMVATVVVRSAAAAPMPAIPLAAVVKSTAGAGGYGVYLVESRDGGDRARLQPITLGSVRGNFVTIAAGLEAGQRIVSSGGLQLANGEAIRQVP